MVNRIKCSSIYPLSLSLYCLMAPVKNGRVLFQSIPTGYPEPGKTTIYDESQTIDIDNVQLDGGFLVKTLCISIDPYMRGRMRDPAVKSYISAFLPGEPLNGHGVAVVIRSELESVKPGNHIYGPAILHQEYALYQYLDGIRIIDNDNKYGLPWSAFIGPLGMPGKTAYMAWKAFSRAKKGEVAFVTTGAGPVGSLVIQLAKNDGLKVIASAGSNDKVEFMKELGADVAFNYKTTSTTEVLEKEGPVDVFWDNVGGETLEAALDAANNFARFIESGMMAGYNSGGVPVRNLMNVVTKSLIMQGFVIARMEPEYDEDFYATVTKDVAEGRIKWKEDVFNGLEQVGEALLAVQKGTNKAKAVVKVADE